MQDTLYKNIEADLADKVPLKLPFGWIYHKYYQILKHNQTTLHKVVDECHLLSVDNKNLTIRDTTNEVMQVIEINKIKNISCASFHKNFHSIEWIDIKYLKNGRMESFKITPDRPPYFSCYIVCNNEKYTINNSGITHIMHQIVFALQETPI